MRASYEVDGVNMRTKNYFQHSRQLPDCFWSGETGIDPVDVAIKKTLQYGYVHHIDRLMVLGNVMLLSEIDPKDVYRWFMAMYVDAYDWVMVPNVYGMSQFADGTFMKNHRMSMMPRLWDKMSEDKQDEHLLNAKIFIDRNRVDKR